jgi:hypothetical protein
MQMKHLNDSEQPRAGVTSAHAVLRSVYVTQRQVNYVYHLLLLLLLLAMVFRCIYYFCFTL